LPEDVDAGGDALGERLVHVEGRALALDRRVLVEAVAERAALEGILARGLRREVDVAAAAAAAVVRRRAFRDLDLLEVVDVAAVVAAVAHAVDEDVVGRVEAPDVEVARARDEAALAGHEGDARRVAQRLAEAAR